MDSQLDGIDLTEDGAVALVTFSRPPQNYFDTALIAELADVFEEVDRRHHLRSIVLRSEGRTFCAGAKFSGNEGREAGADRGDLADPSELYRMGVRLFRTRKPIVVAVQGAAIGGGLGLSMVGDFRVAAPEARFAGNFTKIGIHPGFGLTYILPKVLGQQSAAMLLYTGRRIAGDEAKRIGLVDVLAPLPELQDAAITLAREIAEGAPLAVEATRATLRAGYADAIAAQIEGECRNQVALFATEDFKEGVAAVAERRPGHWLRK